MNLFQPKTDQEKKQKQILMTLLLVGLGFYFLVYLPQEEQKKLEMQIQTDINSLQTIQPQDYSSMLNRLQSYRQWANGSPIQQEALENQRENLEQAVN